MTARRGRLAFNEPHDLMLSEHSAFAMFGEWTEKVRFEISPRNEQ